MYAFVTNPSNSEKNGIFMKDPGSQSPAVVNREFDGRAEPPKQGPLGALIPDKNY